jgi:hypothetical protein
MLDPVPWPAGTGRIPELRLQFQFRSRTPPNSRSMPGRTQSGLAPGRERAYLARLNNVEGTQPSLPSSSLTFHQILSFSPVG